MTSSVRRWRAGWLAVALGATACGGTADNLLAPDDVPDGLTATATGSRSIRLRWSGAAGTQYTEYQLERRRDLQGPFEALSEAVGIRADSVVYFDTELEPDTYYGYRIRLVDNTGATTEPSLIVGARTAPAPGILVQTSAPASSSAVDPDGYTVTIAGPEQRDAAMAPTMARRFSPLAIGAYTVTLRGVASGCAVVGDSVRTATVVEVGVRTIDTVAYSVACRDPSKGGVVILAKATGSSIPANFAFHIEGIVGGSPFTRDVSAVDDVPLTVDGLSPGEYTVEIRDLPATCRVTGEEERPVSVVALGLDTLEFEITCGSGGGGEQCEPLPPDNPDPARPFVLRNEWSASSAAPGSTVTLTVSADLTVGSQPPFGSIQYTLEWDDSRLDLQGIEAATPPMTLTPGPEAPGSQFVSLFYVGFDKTGVVPLLRYTFVVRASAPAGCVVTHTAVDEQGQGEFLSANLEDLLVMTRVREAQLTIGGSGGGTTNQAPIAQPGGPYTATAAAPVTFNGGASSDPDGTIASYSWNPGDGGSALAGASPSKSYAQAGTFTVTLTVTDNLGATHSAGTTVTVTGGGGSQNQAPVARPGGPYTAVVGTPVTFNGGASTDADGTITSYSWNPGDGGPALAGVSPTKTYAQAGTYSLTLTATDDDAATNQAGTTVAVQPAASGTPLALRASFVPGQVAGTIELRLELDLSADLPQTDGPEVLQRWSLGSLSWNERVLKYRSFNTGSGWQAVFPALGGIDPGSGQRTLSTSLVEYAGSGQNRTGVVLLARIGFDVVGAPGTSTTTQTAATLIGTGGTSYAPFTTVQEATFNRP